MVHTRLFGHQAEATQAFNDMKQTLGHIVQCDADTGERSEMIAQFFEQYP